MALENVLGSSQTGEPGAVQGLFVGAFKQVDHLGPVARVPTLDGDVVGEGLGSDRAEAGDRTFEVVKLGKFQEPAGFEDAMFLGRTGVQEGLGKGNVRLGELFGRGADQGPHGGNSPLRGGPGGEEHGGPPRGGGGEYGCFDAAILAQERPGEIQPDPGFAGIVEEPVGSRLVAPNQGPDRLGEPLGGDLDHLRILGRGRIRRGFSTGIAGGRVGGFIAHHGQGTLGEPMR